VADPLSLAIPTFQRPGILEENLREWRAELEQANVPVHLSDDSADRETRQVVERLSRTTSLRLTYRHNQPGLGHDLNLLQALADAQGDHVWLLGDSVCLTPSAIQSVYQQLHGQDFIFVNAREDRTSPDLPALTGPALRQFLVQRTWELTLTGATIYGPRVRAWAAAQGHLPPRRNFPQLDLILGFIHSHADARAQWMGRRLARGHPRKKSYWLAQSLQVFGRDWHAVVSGHGELFDPTELAEVLKSHARNTGFLGLRHLLSLRAQGLLSRDVFKQHRHCLAACSSASGLALELLSWTPVALLKVAAAARAGRREPSQE
jgi:abequosyltransferase